MLQAIRARAGIPSPNPPPQSAPTFQFTAPGAPRAVSYTATPPPQNDAFAGLKGIADFAGNVGNAVGGVMAGAAQLPVVGGALQGLGALADATVRTPVGLAALAADKVLNTGLSAAAEKANAGRPIWELPKTAANVAGEAIGQVASDPTQSLPARALAGAARGIQIGGELVAPVAPGVGLLKGAIAARLGKAAEAAPVVADAAKAAPKVENIADLRARVAAKPSEPLLASRFVDPSVAPVERATADNLGIALADRRASALSTARDTAIRDRVAELTKPSATTADTSLEQALAESLKAKGRPDLVVRQSAPSEFVAANPKLTAIHDANEAVITAMESGDLKAVQAAVQSVKDAGGNLDHTLARVRQAGFKVPTAGEFSAMKGKPTPAFAFVADATPAKPSPAFAFVHDASKADVAPIVPDTTYAGPAGTPPAPPAPPAAPPPSAPTPKTPATGWDKFLSVWNLPKALKASLDLSAPLRQGVLLSVGHPGDFGGAIKAMLHAVGDGKFASALETELKSVDRPGLYFRDSVAPLSARDEAFMSTFADKIPGVSQSQRGFNTFLNKLSADVYDHTVEGWKAGGKQFTEADTRGLADVINHFTGRGDLPQAVAGIGPVLNGLFFSPRYTISRFQSVGDALGVLKNRDNLASQAAATDLVKFVGAGLGVIALAKLAGYKVEDDPRSSAFGKIQIGDTSVDIWGGFQQIARNTAQFMSGQSKPISGAHAGEVINVSRADVATNFVAGKLAPTAGAVLGILKGPTAAGKQNGSIGRNFIGQDFSATDLINPTPGSQNSLLTPLGWDDVLAAIKADRARGGSGVGGAVVGALGLLGAGVQSIQRTGTASPPSNPQANFRFTSPTNKAAAPAAPAAGFKFQPAARSTAPAVGAGPKPSSPDLSSNLDGGGGADVATTIRGTAQQSGIDPNLALATAMMESGLNPTIVGDNGDSHGLFQENVHGRGAGRAPDYSITGQTSRFAADVKRLLATGFRGTPGEIAAAAQRPYDPVGYARKVDAIYGTLR